MSALAERTYDLAIIGGGINGAATAREAALRGLKVALVEARDFSSGTSSRSSKLIHGGLRYLEQFEFKLVHESRTERRILLALAPHLACPLPFVLPIYRGDPYYPLKIRVGLSIYDLLGNLGRADRHRMLNREAALRLIPALQSQDLRAAAVYYDSETDDARLTLEVILAAAEPLAGNPPLLAAEVQFAIHHEMAANVEDFLVRRSGLNWVAACSLRDAAPPVADIFARELGWSPGRREASLAAFACCCYAPASG